MYVDPTGYFWKSIVKKVKKAVKKTADVLILDDLKTLADGKLDGNDVIAVMNLTPWGKAVKVCGLAVKAGIGIKAAMASSTAMSSMGIVGKVSKGKGGLKLDLQFFGRSEKLQPDKTATGSHTVFQRHGETGAIKKYQTFHPQTNPRNPTPWESVIRFDTGGGSHFNTVLKREVPTPLVHDPLAPGGVRAPYNWEIPRVK